MEIIKKYKVFLVLVLIMIVSVFFFFYRMYHKDVKALEGFLASYKKFDKAISDFSKPVFAANLDGAPALVQFNKIYSQITNSILNAGLKGERLALAKEAIGINNDLLDYLNRTDNLESKAGDAFIELNAKAAARISSLIKNDGGLMSTAREIADFSGKELDDLGAYKRAIEDKRNMTNKLLQNIVDDNGGLNGFNNFLNQGSNRTIILSQKSDLDRLSKEFGELIRKRTTAYARFYGLTPLGTVEIKN